MLHATSPGDQPPSTPMVPGKQYSLALTNQPSGSPWLVTCLFSFQTSNTTYCFSLVNINFNFRWLAVASAREGGKEPADGIDGSPGGPACWNCMGVRSLPPSTEEEEPPATTMVHINKRLSPCACVSCARGSNACQ